MHPSIHISIMDENNEEQIMEAYSNEQLPDGEPVYNIFDILVGIAIKRESKFIQECMDRVPEEKRTEETLELLCLIFQMKKKDK